MNKKNIKKFLLFILLIFFVFCFTFVVSRKKQEIINLYTYNIVYKLNYNNKIKNTNTIEDSIGKNEKLGNFYLNLKDERGRTQATHPKVLRFQKKWNGYRYWIAYTPYPYGNAIKENPCVMASNDLVKWNIISKKNIPLDKPPGKATKKRYNSDTHLVYINDTDTLELYWRYVDDIKGTVTIYKMTTKDGIKWSNKEIVLKDNRKKNDYLSPAIIYENGKYMMWYINQNIKLQYTEYDTNKKIWTKPREIKIDYKNKKLKTWHIDVIKNENHYEAIMVAYEDWNNRKNMKLFYSNSYDNYNWTSAKEILNSKKGGLYRISILHFNNNYYILYSEISKRGKRGIGIAYGTDINDLNGLHTKNINKFRKYINLNG